MKRAAVLAVVAMAMVLAASASAQRPHYFPRAHHACRAGYVRRTVWLRRHGHYVRRHGHRVRAAECLLKRNVRKPGTTPQPTTTTLTVTPSSCSGWLGPLGQSATASWQQVRCYRIKDAAVNRAGNPVAGILGIQVSGAEESSQNVIPNGVTCDVEVYEGYVTGNPDGESGGYSPDCTGQNGGAWVQWSTVAPESALPSSWTIWATYLGTSSYAPSFSAPQIVSAS